MRLLRLLLRLRYSLHIKGAVPKSFQPIFVFGTLSSQLDPLLMAAVLPGRTISCHPDQIITMPWLARLYRYTGWLPLPDWDKVISSFAARRFARALSQIKEHLLPRQAYLFFPLGFVQTHNDEPIQPRQPMQQEVCRDLSPPPIVVYARVHGMLGSLFSARAFGGVHAGRLTIGQIVWMLLKNGLFFMPRRKVVVEFSSEPIPFVPEEIQRVPHVRGESQILSKEKERSASEDQIFEKLSQLSKKKRCEIRLEQNLYEDLMLDSLDVTELTVWTREVFDRYTPFERLQTVEDVVRAVTGAYQIPDYKAFEEKNRAAWFRERKKSSQLREPSGSTIQEAFLAVCDALGSEMASADPFLLISYKRLKIMVVGLVESFRALPGKHVGILINNSTQFLVIFMALLLARKVPAILNWTLGKKHIEDAIKLADIQVILSAEPFIDHLRLDLPIYIEEKIRFIDDIRHSLTAKQKLDSLQLARKKTEDILIHFGNHRVPPDDPAALVFTSGTESRPKGVPLSHRNILADQRSLFAVLDLTEKDIILGVLPAFHVYGLSCAILMPLLIGCRVVYVPNLLDFQSTARMIQMWGATMIATTPTFLQALLQLAQPEQLSSVRLITLGAEKSSDSIYEAAAKLPQHPIVIEGYGTTECSPCLTLTSLTGRHKGVGLPLPGVELIIIDPETFHPLPQGKRGLICACGENVFEGYLGGSPDPFIELDGRKWYKTGDLGHLERDGSLILEGRLSRTVKIGGELIHLQALEGVVQSRAPKAALAIIAREGEERPQLVLYITQTVDLETANQWLIDAGLSNLVRLQGVEVRSELPRLATGKIDYRSLK